jgi:hypothetical protein
MINPNLINGRKIWEMIVDGSISKTFVLNIATCYYGNGDSYIVNIPIVFIGILLYNQFHALCRPLLKDYWRGGLNERV